MDTFIEIFNGLITIIVGTFGFGVYFYQKRREKREAAAIITLDIKRAESKIMDVISRSKNNHTGGDILQENSWKKYKHLFISDISTEDSEKFNYFFEMCQEITDANRKKTDIFYAGIFAKSQLMQHELYKSNYENYADFILRNHQYDERKDQVINSFNREDYIFYANEPELRIKDALATYIPITLTSGFTILKKIAQI